MITSNCSTNVSSDKIWPCMVHELGTTRIGAAEWKSTWTRTRRLPKTGTKQGGEIIRIIQTKVRTLTPHKFHLDLQQGYYSRAGAEALDRDGRY